MGVGRRAGGWLWWVPVAALGLVLLLVVGGLGATFLESEPASGCEPAGEPTGTVHGVPANLVPIFERAAARYHLGSVGPAVLAAINRVESDFGRSTLPGVHGGTNSAGAMGPMQFLAASWRAYGVDGDGDGDEDVFDETDAVFGAANLLRASGAPGDWRKAIFTYNHASWYVDQVLRLARRYEGATTAAGTPAPAADSCQSGNVAGDYVNPFSHGWTPGRTDQGVDTCPQGDRPVVAIGDAKVVGSDDHSGWPGGYFIWYRLLDGDHAGLYVYVAEDLRSTVPAGTTVKAGGRIATAYPGPSCIETGFATANGETAAAAIAPHDVSAGLSCPAAAPYNTGAQDGCDTVGGQAFASWLERLGAKVAEKPPPGPTRPPCLAHLCSSGH